MGRLWWLRRFSTGKLDQLLRFFARTEDRHAWNASAHHGDFVAAMQAGAVLAVFEDLVRQLRLIFDGAKSVLEKEVGDAREQADGVNAMFFRLFDERAENAAACALSFGLRLDDDGADLREMGAIQV